MYPWTHRAINQSGQIRSDLVERNIFKLYGNGYHRHAFGQNTWADIFLHQFNSDIEFHLPSRSFGAISPWLTGDMLNDSNLSRQALDYFRFRKAILLHRRVRQSGYMDPNNPSKYTP
jgi:hypothetical protein